MRQTLTVLRFSFSASSEVGITLTNEFASVLEDKLAERFAERLDVEPDREPGSDLRGDMRNLSG